MSRSKSLWATADHRIRRAGLQAARLAAWRFSPGKWPAPELYRPERHGLLETLVYEARAPIARADRFVEPALEAGKEKNVALAAPAFDGVVLAPDRPLSFWRTLGRATARRGYTWGMELRGGCVVPSIAGGLCLLSNAIFEVAARAGFTILERHGHSLEAVPPAPQTISLDATVAWPDVDLVVAPVAGMARLSTRIDGGSLVVTAFMSQAQTDRIDLRLDERIEERSNGRFRISSVTRQRTSASGVMLAAEEIARSERRILDAAELGRSCVSCGESSCADRPRESALATLRKR